MLPAYFFDAEPVIKLSSKLTIVIAQQEFPFNAVELLGQPDMVVIAKLNLVILG